MSRILGALTDRTQKLSADSQLALAKGQYPWANLVDAVQLHARNQVQAALDDMGK